MNVVDREIMIRAIVLRRCTAFQSSSSRWCFLIHIGGRLFVVRLKLVCWSVRADLDAAEEMVYRLGRCQLSRLEAAYRGGGRFQPRTVANGEQNDASYRLNEHVQARLLA